MLLPTITELWKPLLVLLFPVARTSSFSLSVHQLIFFHLGSDSRVECIKR